MPRIACLSIPLFPLAARLRSEPALTGESVAVVEGNGGAARVVAATRRAREKGVHAGLTLAQARALVPKLLARGRDGESERAAVEALLEVAESFSPRVEDAGEGLVFLDVDGLERRWSEERLSNALQHAARHAGLPARMGLASSKLAARVAASLSDSPTLVPHGGEAAFLAPLPIARLMVDARATRSARAVPRESVVAESPRSGSPRAGPGSARDSRDASRDESDALATLERWGVRTIGDLARLPAGDVARRLGEVGRVLHERARGFDPEPLFPHVAPETFTEGLELEWPLVTLEPLLAMAASALERLSRRLESRALGCARLELSLRLEPEGHDVRTLSLPAPTRDVKTLLTLVRLDLERKQPGAPVVAFSLAVHPDRPRRGQLTLFGPPEISPDRLATALAKLFALLGEDRVGSPATVDGHRPERTALRPFTPEAARDRLSATASNASNASPRRSGRGLMAVRVLRPAVKLEVLVATDAKKTVAGAAPPPDLRLLSLKALQAAPPAPQLAADGPVRVASGPWTLEEAWWSEAPVSRDYWDVELSKGGLLRVFRERESDEWFADGVYD